MTHATTPHDAALDALIDSPATPGNPAARALQYHQQQP